MQYCELSTLILREAIQTLPSQLWLRDTIIESLEEASQATSVASFYHRYFQPIILALDDPDDAELVEFLSSRMLKSEEVVNAHVQQ